MNKIWIGNKNWNTQSIGMRIKKKKKQEKEAVGEKFQ